MNKIVVKFGGSNLKSKSDIDKIIRVIKSYNEPLVIVVSAFYGVTDKLNTLLKSTGNNNAIINEIFEPYYTVLDIENRKQELVNLVNNLNNTPNSVSIKNNILSFGERLSSYLLNQILNNNNIKCEEALPENIDLITNNALQSSIISKNTDYQVIAKHFNKNTNYIVPGFYGISQKGEIALFGRGGSDYTASILAYAVNAKSLDLWKDVSGFLSADPKIVEKPIKIKSLTYLEAAELSYFGAKIIHPGTVRPLLKKGIPLNIFNINSTNEGTQISLKKEKSEQILKSITYNNNFVLLKLKGSGVGIKKGILREITQLFDDKGINIRSVITSQIEIDFLLHKDNLQKAYNIAKELQNNYYDLEIEEEISLIAGVGNGIKQTSGIAGKIFGALEKTNINIKHIIFGASDVAIYLIVAKADLKLAINEIHNELFNNKEN